MYASCSVSCASFDAPSSVAPSDLTGSNTDALTSNAMKWEPTEVFADRRYPRNVEGQVRVGLLFLRHLLQDFGDTRKALAAWYTGPARVRRYGIGPLGLTICN